MNKLTVMGAGNYCFDTIVKREYPEGFVVGKRNKFVEKVVSEEIGSNPGNVMCILGYFGWNSCPIALFDDSPVGLQLTKDFERYGCNTRYVTNTPDGGSNILRVTHRLDDKTGLPVTKFSKRHAPNSGFPKDKNLSVQGKDATLPKFIAALDVQPDVFFFEGTTPCWRELAKHFRSRGVLAFYEIQRYSEKEASKYLSCIRECDILKFSDEQMKDPGFDALTKDKLVIQTLGSKGVRFSLRGAEWVTLPPVENGPKVDTEGCGDWTTASFIHALGKRGVLKFADVTEELVRECLMEAQGYAARNVSYMGTKGMIADDKEFGLAPSEYVDLTRLSDEVPEGYTEPEHAPTTGVMGVVCGDIIGIPYEWENNRTKDYNFKMFKAGSHFSDDTVFTLAVAEWLLGERTDDRLIDLYKEYGRRYPKAGFSSKTLAWISSTDRNPTGSAGNGAAMRVSPVAWAATTMEECLALAKQTAMVTHNTEEAVRGAQAVAACVFLARRSKSKEEIREYIEQTFGYDLSKTPAEIRPEYQYYGNCDDSVPQAICCWLYSDTYEGCIRDAVSLGGDADTQAAIAGSIAAATPGMEIPQAMADKAWTYLTPHLKERVLRFAEEP